MTERPVAATISPTLHALTRQSEQGSYTGPFGLIVYRAGGGWTVHTPDGAEGVTLDEAHHPEGGLVALDRFLTWLLVPSHTPHTKLTKTAPRGGQHRYDPWDLTLTTHPHPAGADFTGIAHGDGDEWHLHVPKLGGLRTLITHVHEQVVAL